ncbi:MAG: PEP/pyruvate-binding domain-containing protein, partial [Acidobacteriota bacterium]
MTSWILTADDAIDSAMVGGKARALARAQRAGLPVPPWFVLSASAFEDSLTAEQRAAMARAHDAAALSPILDAVVLNPRITVVLDEALKRLAPGGELLAVRSSASDEDGPQHSFAGQFESYLNVPRGEVADRVRSVWRSGFAARIFAYRREHDLS